MSQNPTRLSKRISWLLRHGANESQLPMDAAGWADIEDVLRTLNISRAELDTAVALNDKQRLQIDGLRVRACQGHSLAGTPVTLDALEASWVPVEDLDRLWHGTTVAAIGGIARYGIRPGQRTHVHLAPERDSNIGKRSAVDYLLEVDTARLRQVGLVVYRAPNGVNLVRHIPANAISTVIPTSKEGTRHHSEALGLLVRTER